MNLQFIGYIVLTFFITIYLSKSYKEDKGLYITEKIIHGFFCYYLGLTNLSDLFTVGWCIGNINKITEVFYIQKGFLPPWATLCNELLNVIFGAIAVNLSLKLALRKESARKKVLMLIPLLSIFGWIEVFSLVIAKTTDFKEYSIMGFVSLIFITPYLIMYFFYTRKKIIHCLFNTIVQDPKTVKTVEFDNKLQREAPTNS